MKEVVVRKLVIITIDGHTRAKEIKYQEQSDSKGKLHLMGCVGRFFSPQLSQAVASGRNEAA